MLVKKEYISIHPILKQVLARLYEVQGELFFSLFPESESELLLVTRSNDNHSPGIPNNSNV